MVYFGIGATIPFIGNPQTIARLKLNYPFTDETALRVVAIYTLGVLLFLMTSSFMLKLLRQNDRLTLVKGGEETAAQRGLILSTAAYSIAFLIVGGALRYGIVIPYRFGLLGDNVIPGVLVLLSNCYYVGIYLMISRLSRFDFLSILPAAIVVLVDAVFCIASFAKAELLILLMFCFLGLVGHNLSWKLLGFGVSLMLAAFFTMQPLVEFGRQEIQNRYGVIRGAPIGERLSIIGEYFRTDGSTGGDGTQTGLIRLSYMAPSAFVVDNFDSGDPGHTFKDAAAVFVPRALWPNKPIISALGEDLNQQMTGQRGSALGIGHFIEAYWNFGWLGIPVVVAMLSLVFSLTSWFSLGVMERKDWLYLPVVLLSLQMGIRVDGHFVVDILGPAWIALVVYVALAVLKRATGLGAAVSR